VLRNRLPLRRRQLKPPHGNSVVLFNAVTERVHRPEGPLRQGMSLIRSELIPAPGLGRIRRYALTIEIQETECALGLGIASFCQGPELIRLGGGELILDTIQSAELVEHGVVCLLGHRSIGRVEQRPRWTAGSQT